MRRPLPHTRILLAAVGAATALLACSAAAQASTLYACVKKDGSAHIYAKKTRCHRGEHMLHWNSEGPAGRNGTNGTNGAGGAQGLSGLNGAAAVLSAIGPTVNVSGGTLGTLVSRTLPAGNYVVDGYIYGDFSDPTEAVEAYGFCHLTDTPAGGSSTSAGVQWEDKAQFHYIGGFHYDLVLPLALVVSSPSAESTVALTCESNYDTAKTAAEFDFYFEAPEIVAVQVASVG